MIIMDLLFSFFGIEALVEIENFAQFLPWFVRVLGAIFIYCFTIKGMYAYMKFVTGKRRTRV